MSLIRAELKGRDLIEIETSENGMPRVKALGCSELLDLLHQCRSQFGADPHQWPLPEGLSHSELLLKEALLKLKGQWDFPFKEEEICHCRSVPAEVVDQAVIAGAHRTEVVSRRTSASTSCGTCRMDVQKIIDYRLKK